MSEDPLVSVVLPAYNARAYIAQAIRSVLDQDYQNLEIIVVDDGSSDGTPDEARLFGERVRVIEQKNGGPAAARNRGVAHARGKLLAFIDADDLWLPGKLRAQVDYLRENAEAGVVFGRFVRWIAREDGAFDPPPEIPLAPSAQLIVPEASGWIYPELLLDSVIWIVSAMVRREIWDALGGLDPALRCGEDYDFFIRASRICKMDKLDRVVAYYRIHTQSTTHVVRDEDFECKVLVRSLKQFGTAAPDGREVSRKLLSDRLFRIFFNHGYRHYKNGSPRIAASAFLQALLNGRRASFKALAFLVLSFFRSLASPASR
jgi:glycosyltransferase involved in cell wall biosynthesis